MPSKFLVKHIGNLGDLVFLVPPILATLKRLNPDCHITFVTAWGFKVQDHWGSRGQDGAGIALMMTNPDIDQLIHWHDTKLSLTGDICMENGQRFPTWSKKYYLEQKNSGAYDHVYELDIGLPADGNPLQFLYVQSQISDDTYTNYQLYLTEQDRAVAEEIMREVPKPRIVLLEGLAGRTTRGWDPGKTQSLEQAIKEKYGVRPMWFGAAYQPYYQGRLTTLRENIATLMYCDVAIGVLSGPLHFAAAVGLPTITLFADQPLKRAAPAYFLNQYINDPSRHHRTLLGPSSLPYDFLKPQHVPHDLTPTEQTQQQFTDWPRPGRQDRKSGVAVITVDEVMQVLADSLK